MSGTYKYQFYITGYKKHIDEFIMIITETAAVLTSDHVSMVNQNISEDNIDSFSYEDLNQRRIFKLKPVIKNVTFEDCSLDSILSDKHRIPQSMQLSNHKTYKVTAELFLPIRDDRLLQAKGIVDAIRFEMAMRNMFQYPSVSFDTVYTYYCSILIRNTYNKYYMFPIRPDYSLKQCFNTWGLQFKDHKSIHIDPLIFVHKINLLLDISDFSSDFNKKYNVVYDSKTDYIVDIQQLILDSLNLADLLYYLLKNPNNPDNLIYPILDNKQNMYTPVSVFNEYVRMIFTSHFRTDIPNTYHNITEDPDDPAILRRRPDNSEGYCLAPTESYWILNYPKIRISKEIINSRTELKQYLYNYYNNTILYAYEYFANATV